MGAPPAIATGGAVCGPPAPRPALSAPPAVRGATLFGQALLKNAYISVQSANQRSNFPGRLDDLPPIAGFQVRPALPPTHASTPSLPGIGQPCRQPGAAPLPALQRCTTSAQSGLRHHSRHVRHVHIMRQPFTGKLPLQNPTPVTNSPYPPTAPHVPRQWYDTRTMTIIKDTTFANYKWQPQLGNYRMAVFYVRWASGRAVETRLKLLRGPAERLRRNFPCCHLQLSAGLCYGTLPVVILPRLPCIELPCPAVDDPQR